MCSLSIREAANFLESIHLSPQEQFITEKILKEIGERIHFLIDVGVDYLNLARSAGTLSGGEMQRLRLASQIGSGLVGVLYILDEPTIGLHQRDTERLILSLMRLRNMGNTVLVVEHDRDMMEASDQIIDMGPGAGLQGGYVVFQGTPAEIRHSPDSLTGHYLSGEKSIRFPPPVARPPKDAS